MGFFRILFALVVVLGHLGLSDKKSFFMFDSSIAVASFFIISGFYMSLVLNKKYIGAKGSYWLFISNRILRIYPIYLTVLLIMLLVYAHHLPLSTYTFSYVCSNLLIFCSPAYFIPNQFPNLLVVQAWTVGIEMMFYFTAPFILRSWKKVSIFLILSILLRYFGNHSFLGINFFLFMLGAISYLIYTKVSQTKTRRKHLNYLAFLLIAFIIIPYIFLSKALSIDVVSKEILAMIYYLSFMLVIPIIFLLSSKNRIDKLLGDYSYAIYICHGFVLFMLRRLLHYNYQLYVISALILTFVFSFLLLKYIDYPIQQIRSYRVKHFNKKKILLLQWIKY